ncbi:MAG TPA: PqqD family protein [Candidatus Aphodomonas merdavium]|nr:PqqD family protein [Candidatus Aphodomonas merdavium]
MAEEKKQLQQDQQQQTGRLGEEITEHDFGTFPVDAVPEQLKQMFGITQEALDAVPAGMQQTYSHLEVRVGVKDGYILRKVGEAYMVMPTGARMKEYRGMITLNETGAFLFQEAQKPEPTREKLIAAAMKEYNVEEIEAAENVDSFVQQCAECNLFQHVEFSVTVYRPEEGDAPQAEDAPAQEAPNADGTK